VVRFKAGKTRYAAQMEWSGSDWEGGVYRLRDDKRVCAPFTRWGNGERNVTMRFKGRCVRFGKPRWVEGSGIVYTSVGTVADHVARSYG
jgi:hypothetical protein